VIAWLAAQCLSAQTTFTWQEIKDKFEAANPTLKAAQLNIDESRAEEITAYLRPNPTATGLIDQINPFTTQPPPSGGPSVYRPFAYALPYGSVSYLHEREHKRELRLESAKKATDVATSAYSDQERGLIFNLRSSCKHCKPKQYSKMRNRISITGTRSLIYNARASRPAI
jgi:cobalt-zinc-cadmium efflux system outer membrane protein